MTAEDKKLLKQLKAEFKKQLGILQNLSNRPTLYESELTPMFSLLEKTREFLTRTKDTVEATLFLTAACEINAFRDYIGKNTPRANAQRIRMYKEMERCFTYVKTIF